MTNSVLSDYQFQPVETMVVCIDCGREFLTVRWPNLCDGIAGQVRCDECLYAFIERRDAYRKDEMLASMLATSGIHKSYIGYDPGKDKHGILNFIIRNIEDNIVIPGAYQIGKTHCACHAGIRVAKSGKSVMYFRVSDMLRTILGTMGQDMALAEFTLDKIKRMNLLILDDFGKEKLTDRAGEIMFSIIDFRLLDKRPTWITTNMHGKEFAERLGDDRGGAILARIRANYAIFGS
jgi:hypothetical protein